MSSVMAGDAAARLPRTWRPFGARIVATVLGLMLVLVCVVTWLAWGPSIRASFTPLQRVTLILVGLLGFICWFALVRSRVSATEERLVVVNGYRKRVFEWSQVVGVTLRRGAPWASMDLSDGTTISVLAIQGSDGRRATDAVRSLRTLVARQTGPVPND
ncbi:MAG: PH domain-containing protein [Actinomycetota bacterium]|nr:PH domain-containing protein [Actinomycetota bacterium]